MMMTRRLLMALPLLLAACSTATWMESADEEVGGILDEKRVEVAEFRTKELVNPIRDARSGDTPPSTVEDLSDIPRTVGLAEALQVATRRNRDYTSQKESLYLSALSLTNVRNEFSPFFAGTLAALLSDTDDSRHLQANDLGLSVRQILPTGGTVTVEGNTSADAGGGATDAGYSFSSGWSVNLSQPLLRDAGYETSHESLVQAERDVIYAVRDFELFREDFTIEIVTQYYNLVRQLREIENARQLLKLRKDLLDESTAKYAVEMATLVDKLRAQREYLRAKNDLEDQLSAYDLAVDRFKIRLGLPTSFPLEVRSEEPNFKELDLDLKRAADAALHNRLDLITERDRLVDAERSIRIRVNQMLPDLDLTAGYGNDAPSNTSFGRQAFKDESYTLGMTLRLPLERTSERNALRRAIIDRDRSKRALTLAEDNVILDVRNSLRRVRRTEASLEIRKEEIKAAELELEAAVIRFSEGTLDNLNVTEAQNAVFRAKNSLIRDLLEYEVARIQLFRDMGVLFVDENGIWVEP